MDKMNQKKKKKITVESVEGVSVVLRLRSFITYIKTIEETTSGS